MKIFGWEVGKVFREILPAFIFFYIMFNVLVVTKALTLKQYGISIPASAFALVGALIIAKVVFIANRIPFLNVYPRLPLIYNIILKTIVYSFFTLIFIILEELIHTSRHYGSIAAGYAHLAGDIFWPAFLAREIWLTILLFFYCASAELARVIGPEKVKALLFGSPSR